MRRRVPASVLAQKRPQGGGADPGAAEQLATGQEQGMLVERIHRRTLVGEPTPVYPFDYARARRRPSALCRVSAYSASGVESATMPPPTGNCTQPRPAVKVRISRLVSIVPSKPM